jgi:hypothetical protein
MVKKTMLVEGFKDSFPLTVVEAPAPAVVEVDPVLNVLERALARLSKRGAWIKGALRRKVTNPETGKDMYGYCMLGAIGVGSPGIGVKGEAEELLVSVLPRGYRNVAEFNDSDYTNLHEVQSVFKKAISKRKRSRKWDK